MRKQLGKYEILRRLGQGGMGSVYLAHDTVLDRDLALKTILPDKSDLADSRRRFFQEAKVIARLQHPALVTLFDYGEDDGINFLAMEYVPGMDLEEALGRACLTPHQLVETLAQVCEGLAHAHARGVVHRDIKPSNIRVFGVQGKLAVKILDFGLARRFKDSLLTHSSAVVGTPYYIAPEVLKGAEPDPRSDLWALGVILYQALSGGRPFEASSPASIHFKIVYEALPPLTGCFPPFQAGIGPLLEKALMKEPAGRFGDAAAMAAALRALPGFDPTLGLASPPFESALPEADQEDQPTQYLASSQDPRTTPLQGISSFKDLPVPGSRPPSEEPPPSPLRELMLAAAEGNPDALNRLGLRFLLGDGVLADAPTAMEHFRRGAERGSPEAMLNLGNLLLHQTGGPREAAEGWLAAAADAGLAEAHAALGVALLDRDGPTERALASLDIGAGHGLPTAVVALGRHLAQTVPAALSGAQRNLILQAAELNDGVCQLCAGDLCWQDGQPEAALGWFERASSRGLEEADRQAANLLLQAGRDREAIEWLRKAVRKGSHDAQLDLAKILLRHDSSKGQAVALLKQAAMEGNAEAMYLRACLLLEEPGHRQDPAAIQNLLQHAAQHDHPPAMLRYGQALIEGWTQPPDPTQGLPWVQKAAAAGLPEAAWFLGTCLLQGKGILRDPRAGRSYIQQAAQAGVPEAQYEMGRMLADSEAGRRQPELALAWYRRAADAGMVAAMHQVGLAHADPKGPVPNPALGFQWLLKAAEAGHTPSMGQVARMYASGLGVAKDPLAAKGWETKSRTGGSKGSVRSIWPFSR